MRWLVGVGVMGDMIRGPERVSRAVGCVVGGVPIYLVVVRKNFNVQFPIPIYVQFIIIFNSQPPTRG